MKLLRVMIALLLVAGGCLTGRALYLHAKAALAGVLIHQAWEETLRAGEPQRPWRRADTHPVARLRIPRLEYDEIVLEGATARTLAFGPARLRSGAAPGEPGNIVLAGHRTSWFRPLERLAPSDIIELEWRAPRRAAASSIYDHAPALSGFSAFARDSAASSRSPLRRKTYVVDAVFVVAPDDARLLAPTADDMLTLITCYPFGRGPDSPLRFVVRASPLENGMNSSPTSAH